MSANREEFRKYCMSNFVQESTLMWQGWQACAELKDAEIAKLREELDALKSTNSFDASRLRRLAAITGVSAPVSDEDAIGCAGALIGSICGVVKGLYARPVPSIPEGYVLVPIDPTDAMLKVGRESYKDFRSIKDAFTAMLSAAKEQS